MRAKRMRVAALTALLAVPGATLRPTIVPVIPPDAIPVVDGGSFHSLAVRADGTVWAFGSNSSGQLGADTGGNEGARVVSTVPGLTDITQVSGGAGQSLALRRDGSVWAFGENSWGQLGFPLDVGTVFPTTQPLPIPGLPPAKGVAAGTTHSLVLASDGTVWAFGSNGFGQLGRAANTIGNPVPTVVPGLDHVVAVAAGQDTSVALRADGTVWTFGSNASGQLGRPDNSGVVAANPVPAVVPGLTAVTAIAAGAEHVLARRDDGTVWAFGSNVYGQLGSNANVRQPVPHPVAAPVAGLTDVTLVAAGGFHSLARRTDGSVWSFGDDDWGQLGRASGLATGLIQFDPTPAPVISGIVAIGAGANHSLAVTHDGVVWTFGDNAAGQLGHSSGSFPFFLDGRTPTYSITPAPTQVLGLFGDAAHFIPLNPTRLLDTRAATAVGYDGAKPSAGATIRLPVSPPIHGYPVAVALNVTATEADAPGYVQVYPTGAAVEGRSSTLNIDHAGQTIANGAIVAVGTDRSVSIHVQSGTHLVVDITGWFEAVSGPTRDGRLVPVAPVRVFDTRTESGTPPPAASRLRVRVRFLASLPATGVGAVVVNVTATDAVAPGFVQVVPEHTLVVGTSSTLNLERAGQTIANMAIVALDPDGSIDVYLQSGTHLVVDVLGYVTDTQAPAGTSGLYVPVTPGRLLDTRTETRVGDAIDEPRPGALVRVPTLRRAGLPFGGVGSVTANLTATEAAGAGWVQAAAAGQLVPGATSNVNLDHAGQTVANGAIVPITAAGFDLYVHATTHLVADVTGWFSA